MVLKIAGIGLDAATGDRLEQAQYKEDFRRRLQDIDGQDMLKLERRQVFRQPGTPSWEAFVRGDWEQALRIYQDKLETLRASLAARRDRGIDYRRVRVVEKPIIPYVQWELNVFRVRTAAGERIRVVGPEAVSFLEQDGPLPELINLGPETLYEICYDEHGVANGAVRYTDPELVANYRRLVDELYENGEDFRVYFEREVAHLPPPPPGG